MIGPAQSTDAPQAPLVKRINSVSISLDDGSGLESIQSERFNTDVVEPNLRLYCHMGHPYAVKISHGGSKHAKSSGDFRVAATRCADRGAEIGECRYGIDLLSRDCEIRRAGGRK